MSDQQTPIAPEPEPPSPTPARREAWTPPTLESLDVSQTMTRLGAGTDGGPIGSTLS